MAWKAQLKVNITKRVDWSFQKCLKVSFFLKMMDFSICIPNQISLSNHFFEKEAKYGPTLIGYLQVVVGFCKFHRQRTPKFFPVPSQLKFTFSMVTGLTCIMRAVFRPGLVYYRLNRYKMYPLIHLGPEECHCPCNDVLLKAIIGVLAFIILLLIAYIIWLHRRGK